MTETLQRASEAFIAALQEARTVTNRDQLGEVVELLSHARELLDIVDEELAALPSVDSHIVADAALVAKAMRDRLAALEATLIRPRH